MCHGCDAHPDDVAVRSIDAPDKAKIKAPQLRLNNFLDPCAAKECGV